MPAPALLVGIDTESDNQWDAAARARPTFGNLYALPTLHGLLRRHGARPTYLITYPVARDARSVDVLRSLLDGGGCEVGAHHHAWETPPCGPEDIAAHAYASRLPIERFDAQLEHLTAAIEEATGTRPVSYRSGRFGFCAAHVASLERCGYLVESSVAPLFCETHKGGPDFADAPLRPYFLSFDEATRPGTSQVLEIPVSCGLDRRWPPWLVRAWTRAPWPYTTKRYLRKLRVVRPMWLRPSYSPLDDMITLARRLVEQGEPVLNVLFHSSEIIAGGSPYNRTAAEVDAFLDRLARWLGFAVERLGAIPMTFAEFRARYCGSTGS